MYISVLENSEGFVVVVTVIIFFRVPSLCGQYRYTLHVTSLTEWSLAVSANRRRLRPFQTPGSSPRQMSSISRKALIYGTVVARTWNFAPATRNVVISDLQRFAEVLPGHWWRKLIRVDTLRTLPLSGNLPAAYVTLQHSLIFLQKLTLRGQTDDLLR